MPLSVSSLTNILLKKWRPSRFIPLIMLYLLAFLDRTNIGNAMIDGLQNDLNHMSGGHVQCRLQ